MNILLLGGSNAGLHYGWAAQFQAIATEHRVTNRFLGAVGSLYGLLRLIEMEDAGEPAPDLLIFEYALNDAVLMDAGWLRVDLLDDTLDAVAAICARRKVPLLLLRLELRPSRRARVNRAMRRVDSRYRAAARRNGLCPGLTLHAALGGVRAEDYTDKHHLTEPASKRVALALLETISSRRPQIPRMTRRPAEAKFAYTPARRAETLGPCRRVDVVSTVYRGEFLEISRGGSSHWPGRGLVVGLLLRATADAGCYRLRTGAAAYRKNPQSSMREIAPKLILLHYTKNQPEARDDLEIAMPPEQSALAALDEDESLLSANAQTPFDLQILEIAGVMFWRKPSRLRRWRARFLARMDAVALWPWSGA